MKGKIYSVVKDRNYGFIRSEDNKEIFFHFSEIKFRGDVKPGIKVEFEHGRNKKGVTAVNIIRQKRNQAKKWDDLISFIENAKIDEESRKIFLKNLAQFRQQELHILIAGPTGVGKSSTINALFDKEVAEVGYGVDTQTKVIKEWKLDENLFLHDTPGLGDGATADLLYKQMIKEELGKKHPDGSAVIDVALIIIDGSHRDMGTSIDLINDTIIPNIDKSRVLVAINQCDMADGGRGWNKKGNCPNKELVQRLNEKTESVQRRIKESTGVDIQPIYYSALHKYNISKLLSFIIKCTPVKKRFFYINNLNNDEQIWKYNDRSECDNTGQYYSRRAYVRYEDLSDEVTDLNQSVTDLRKSVAEIKKTYQQEAAEMISEALGEVSKEISKGSKTSINLLFNETIQNISDGISAGAQAGEKIGNVIPVIGRGAGRIIGGVIGGVGGLIKSIIPRK